MVQLVECVPNFSNGRDPAVYNNIADTIRAVAGVHVLNVSADADHNRTVITFVGTPSAVEDAAYHAILKAAQLINLDEHEGEHPRIGATDVCPFIPIRGVTRKACVQMAQRLGQRLGEMNGIAIYLYGDAATRPERVSLSDIRQGEYEGWKAEVATEAWRKPDFGPAEPKPWGATVIGVRPFLIAYNIYLNSSDVSFARKIARTVRHSSGGLRNVQAKGFSVAGQAQVSMNLTDFRQTPIPVVQEMVRREAARYGLLIAKSELVGLIPTQALIDTAKYYLQLDEMPDSQLLEYRLQEQTQSNDFLPTRFLEATAALTPTPGGGSVAALVAAMAAALTQMVAGLTMKHKKYDSVKAEVGAILADALDLQEELTLAAQQDMEAYEQVILARRNVALSAEEKLVELEKAMLGAAEVPLRVARLGCDVAQLAKMLVEKGNVQARSDVITAVLLADAAVQSSSITAQVNLDAVAATETAALWRAELDELVSQVAELRQAVMRAIREG